MNNVYMGLDVEDFIFDESATYEDYNVSEEDMNRFGVIECVDDPDLACYRIALENEQNHNAIMMAMLQNEYNVLESTGSVMVYEGAKLNQFFDMVKTQIQKFWAKVKGVFKKVTDQINSIVLSNKAFAKKYRGLAGSIKQPKDKGFTGYPFDQAVLEIPYSKVVSVLEKIKDVNYTAAEAKHHKMSAAMDAMRGALCDDSSGVKAEEFETTLKMRCFGSTNTTTVRIKHTDFGKLLDTLEDAEEFKKIAKGAYKEAENSVKKLLSEVNKEKAKAEANENETKVKSAKLKGEMMSKSLTLMSTAMNVQTRAIVTMAAQARKMANYWVKAGKPKKGSANESYEFEGIDVEII